MAEGNDVHNALTAIHSRLGTIEGRVTLIARAERKAILESLKSDVSKKPLIGQIYLALDGERNQREVFELLTAVGIETSEMGVSRAMGTMHTEMGIIELAAAGGSKIFRKGDESEAVLNLSSNIRDWLKAEGESDPAPPPGRKRRKA